VAVGEQAEQIGPVVSVIIPCYNQAEFLADSIESVLVQTYSPVECIVVDDGSPDHTAEIAARYLTVTCIRRSNGGIAIARNAGFYASRGEYVAFLDADDRLTSSAVNAHLRCFAEHPEAAFVVGDIDHIGTDGSYCGSPRWPLLTDNQYEELLKVNHVANTIAVMFRREVIRQVGGFEAACSPASDYRILLQAARSFPSAHHRNVVAQYRRHPQSMSVNGALMLRATGHVMRMERSSVGTDERLKAALRSGEAYWRDHFGAVTIKQMFRQLSGGKLLSSGRLLLTLAWYVRGRLFLLPWKHLRRRLSRRHAMSGDGTPLRDTNRTANENPTHECSGKAILRCSSAGAALPDRDNSKAHHCSAMP